MGELKKSLSFKTMLKLREISAGLEDVILTKLSQCLINKVLMKTKWKMKRVET